MNTRLLPLKEDTRFDLSRLLYPLIFGLILFFHLLACFSLLPPSEVIKTEPLISADHPVHTHRVHVYRQSLFESGLPWGYDPKLSAGVTMSPESDAGAKPQEFLSVLLPFLSPGSVVRLFLFSAALLFPLWSLLATRIVGLPFQAYIWILLALLTPAWLYENLQGFFRWGLASFATAGYFSPLVLALFVSFINHPCLRNYLYFFFAASAIFMLHILGPVVILPPLVFYTLFARNLGRKWRFLLILTPVGIVIINGFWFFPLIVSRYAPEPPWTSIQMVSMDPDLTYKSLSQMFSALTLKRILAAIGGIGLAIYGLHQMRRFSVQRAVTAFALAGFFGIALKFFGSFMPVLPEMQPSRFLLPAVAILSLPTGMAAFCIAQKFGRWQFPIILVGVLGISFVLYSSSKTHQDGPKYTNYAGQEIHYAPSFMSIPQSVPTPNILDPLTQFVLSHTSHDERLLVQTRLQGEPKILPIMWGREVVGNNYPFKKDPAQFLLKTLWGKKISEWSPEDLRSVINRWGVSWVFTVTEDARILFSKVTNQPGESVGIYHAFQVSTSPNRFLVGEGRINAKINRIELTDLEPKDNLIVLRYRYHPAWKTNTGLPVHQFPLPEDPLGFIALKAPPKELILNFAPWDMLVEEWPEGRME